MPCGVVRGGQRTVNNWVCDVVINRINLPPFWLQYEAVLVSVLWQ
jgi:hypothetical protein